jgi:hypothetical protein
MSHAAVMVHVDVDSDLGGRAHLIQVKESLAAGAYEKDDPIEELVS